jgi:hypothetical protein
MIEGRGDARLAQKMFLLRRRGFTRQQHLDGDTSRKVLVDATKDSRIPPLADQRVNEVASSQRSIQ